MGRKLDRRSVRSAAASWPPWAILCAFAVLGIIYGFVDPIFEASDELNHYPYVAHLALGQGLPVQHPGEFTLWRQEGSQPPLYYALAAALTSWVPIDDLSQVLRLNPHARVGIPMAQDNKNMVVHSDREAFPWHGTTLAVHLIRFFSVALAMGTLWCTYLLALAVFPGQTGLASAAMATNAFLPMFVFISASVNNDNLVIFLCSLALLLLFRFVRRAPRGSVVEDRAGLGQLVLIGVVIGLACLTKESALGLLPVAALAAALRRFGPSAQPVLPPSKTAPGRESRDDEAGPPGHLPASISTASAGGGAAVDRMPFGVPAASPAMDDPRAGPGHVGKQSRERQPRAAGDAGGGRRDGIRDRAMGWIADCAAFGVPAALVAGWWYVRNWQLYGDPLGLNVMLDIAGRRPTQPRLLDLWNEFEGWRISFWGLFGGVNVLMRPPWIYHVLDGLALLVLLGLMALALRLAWRGGDAWLCEPDHARRDWPWRELLLATAWIAGEMVALVRWTMSTFASQGRLVFPALSAICLLLALGAAALWPARLRGWPAWVLPGLLCVLAVSSPFLAIRPAYALPPILTPAQVPAEAQAFDATYGGVVKLLAFEVDKAEVRPGDSLPVTLYWQALAPMPEDYSVYVQLIGQGRSVLAQLDSYAGGTYPTSRWQPGQVIEDKFQVEVRVAPAAPVAASLEAGLYRLSAQQRLAVTDPRGKPVGVSALARIKVAVPTSAFNPSHPLTADLDQRVRLAGFDLPSGPFRPGSEVPLVLYWQVLASLDGDYTVFVHLVDAQNHMVGQGDGPPLGNDYPTHFWSSGENLADGHVLRIAADAPPGIYSLYVGLYRPDSGRRLPVEGGGDQVPLGNVQVGP